MTAPSPKEFRTALKAFVGTCSVLTCGEGAQATGLIVTSTISPSADPPRLLACVNRSASSWQVLQDKRRFGWSSLGAEHRAVAERFSGFGDVHGPARYDGATWETVQPGMRLLIGAPAAFGCIVEDMIDRDGYSIIIGRVECQRMTEGAGGLVWWNGFRALPE